MRSINIILVCAIVLSAACKSKPGQDLPRAKSRPLFYNSNGIAASMASYGCVDGAAIGIAGQMSEQFKRYLKLSAHATTEELIQLTDHKSPVVRVYAFWALTGRKYEGLDFIYLKHMNDTTRVYAMGGCVRSTQSVSDMYKSCMADRKVFESQ